jgi:hypothetical protein
MPSFDVVGCFTGRNRIDLDSQSNSETGKVTKREI